MEQTLAAVSVCCWSFPAWNLQAGWIRCGFGNHSIDEGGMVGVHLRAPFPNFQWYQHTLRGWVEQPALSLRRSLDCERLRVLDMERVRECSA